MAQHVGPVTWNVVEDCLPAICDAINLPQIATSMRLLVHKLAGADAAVGEERIERSDLELLGRVLYLDEHALSGAHHLLGDQLEVNLAWMRAVVHLVGGADALDSFDRGIVGAVSDLDVLRTVLAPLLTPAGISSEAVIDACQRSFTTQDFREQLEFTLASFNESLIATGSEPETYPALHADQVLHYVTDHEVEMIQALRNRVAAKLDRREPAPEYVRLRDGIRSIARPTLNGRSSTKTCRMRWSRATWGLGSRKLELLRSVRTRANFRGSKRYERPTALRSVASLQSPHRSFALGATNVIEKRQRCGPTRTCQMPSCATSLRPLGLSTLGKWITPTCSAGVPRSGFGQRGWKRRSTGVG